MKLLFLAAACSAAAALPAGAAPPPVQVSSPDGKNTIELNGIGDAANGLLFKVSRGGRPIVELAAFEVHLAEGAALSGAARLDGVELSKADEIFPLPWGKSKEVLNRCARATVHLTSDQGTQWDIDLAAYDDGIAFRYRLPEQEKLTQFTITGESGNLNFAGVPTLHYTAWDRFTNDHEAEFHRDSLTGVTGPLVDLPLLAVWTDGMAAGLTEARVRDFSNLYLELEADADLDVFHLRLSHPPHKDNACVTGRTPLASPWRAVFLGDSAGGLLESNLLLCLNDPPTGDFTWAKPGKTTWHWWNGTLERDPALVPGMNLETHRRYIDFCATNGIAYHAVISDAHPWHVQKEKGFSPQADTDILTPRPGLELPEILNYAKQRGVGIRLWLHWEALAPHLEEAFQRYEEWGVSGLMVDFLNRDDQEVVNFCEAALESAARHKLHLQFHGSYKPSGEQRTHPHLFNREGVLNLEYLKWSKRCTPPHNVEAAYVRQLAGPLDYHLGGFNSVSNTAFVAREESPSVLGTRCHHLAMYVVYENPMPMVADSPERYEGQTGFDFIVNVPTTWDETRFVTGVAGDFIVMARRSGGTWYVGGMTDWTAREVSVPLHFLAPGHYDARLYVDGSMSEEEPNAIRAEEKRVESGMSLPVSMAPGGGFTAIITPR
ncbi:MAG: glycoside hydrolase family 97 catalytic domain-containing protein [Candidatus Hydrogenedentes bacterium]|nr:glycoside hydrolase family 97 catalytic domain-containing protein [Candidatus Hydrogenedentota bacterium]